MTSDKDREAANAEFFDCHACLTGDCPHDMQSECLIDAFLAGLAHARRTQAEWIKKLENFMQHKENCRIARVDSYCSCGLHEELAKWRGGGG